MVKIMAILIYVIFTGSMLMTPVIQADEVDININQVSKQVFMITGKGGNIGLIIGKDGTFLIDDQYAPLTELIIKAIKSVGGSHPKFLINTHYHGDHTGGNEKLGQGGTLIFSHDNVRERLVTGSFIKAFNKKREGLSKVGLPVVTFSEDISFHLNGETIHAIHAPYAHSDSDSFIHFKTANVIHTGDLFFNGFYPFIDVNHGGTLKGMIKGVDRILMLADDKTKIIPGHGPIGNRKQLKSYRQMLRTAYERLRKLKAEGKTAKEAAAEKPLADLEAVWGDGLFKADRWIGLIYSGV